MDAIVEKYKEIEINLDSVTLTGNLRLLENSKGIIIFSHGSGSSRFSIRNNYVAGLLLDMGFSSLLFDLLTISEDLVYDYRFDIELLSKRLLEVTKWVRNYEETKHLKIGFFGASTGAASALTVAPKLGKMVKAIVSRGGRPDLAMNTLAKVNTPTLLIVGGYDKSVIELNKIAQSYIPGICDLKIVPEASHLFEERGKLAMVAKLTGDWFTKYLT